MPRYQPPYTITPTILDRIAAISENLGRLSVSTGRELALRLRRINRIRTIQGSLAIEGNTLSEAQITAILQGKRVLAPPREVQEARNAIAAYDQMPHWQATREADLLHAHRVLMHGLIDEAGHYRHSGVGVMKGPDVVHMAPPANRVPILMAQLLDWLAHAHVHPLITSCIFHYEFEFIHPFADGNGRMGRLWQTLMLSQWNPLFAHVPVESLVHEHQSDYYQALQTSTARTDSAPFIEFMLAMIQDALSQLAPQDSHHVTPQVMTLLRVLNGTMSRDQLQAELGLRDRKSFRQRYLLPALAAGLITMTMPDRPNSRFQQYQRTHLGNSML